MRAIQTHYKGHKFRSRLEARWAVFFDALGIKWIYEPEGYELDCGTLYLPDFFLPEVKLWLSDKKGVFLEVKPPVREIEGKWEIFGLQSEYPIIMIGELMPEGFDLANYYIEAEKGFWWFVSKNGGDGPYVFCECIGCGKIGIEFDGRSARIDCNCSYYSDKNYNEDSIRIQDAYRKARKARFEHKHYEQ
jgi:hypothetical protein